MIYHLKEYPASIEVMAWQNLSQLYGKIKANYAKNAVLFRIQEQ